MLVEDFLKCVSMLSAMIQYFFQFQSPNNRIRFSLAGDRHVLDFFLVDSVTGDVSLRRPVRDDLNDTAVFQVSGREYTVCHWVHTLPVLFPFS